MLARIARALVLVALVILTTSCRKIEGVVPGGLTPEAVRDGKVLPAEWGNLVSVTTIDQFPGAIQLWFQDSAGNVRVATYSLRTSQFVNVTVMRRQ